MQIGRKRRIRRQRKSTGKWDETRKGKRRVEGCREKKKRKLRRSSIGRQRRRGGKIGRRRERRRRGGGGGRRRRRKKKQNKKNKKKSCEKKKGKRNIEELDKQHYIITNNIIITKIVIPRPLSLLVPLSALLCIPMSVCLPFCLPVKISVTCISTVCQSLYISSCLLGSLCACLPVYMLHDCCFFCLNGERKTGLLIGRLEMQTICLLQRVILHRRRHH